MDLNAYEADFRDLDPQIGKWWQIDPKTEHMEQWSPYASNYDNPIQYNDPDGMKPETQVVNSKGAIVYDDKKDDGNVYILKNDNTKITPSHLKTATVQLVKDHVWVGTDDQLKDFVTAQAKQVGAEFGTIIIKQDPQAEGYGFITKMGDIDMNKNGVTVHPLDKKDRTETVINIPGTRNVTLDNIYNTRSALEHEKRHTLQFAKKTTFKNYTEYENYKETDAINTQKKGQFYNQTTTGFKKFVEWYRKQYQTK